VAGRLSKDAVRATVAIPTFNGIGSIDAVLDMCLAQSSPWPFEVLVIDSGSTDGTLDAVRRKQAVRLHQIPQSEFGHGRTRNLAVSLARGEYIVFLTQDAVPASNFWMQELLRPFELSKDVACVFGKQVPRPDCCPTVKRDVINHFRAFGADPFITLQVNNPRVMSQMERDMLTYFSDVNSAVRRRTIEEIPFRDVPYAEDQALGRDVIEAGLVKAYAPLGAVFHSHSYPLRRYFARMYDEMHGLWKTSGRTIDTSVARHIAIVGRGTLGDWRFILRDHDYSPARKLYWLIQAPFYNLARRVAVRLALQPQLPGWAAWIMGRPHPVTPAQGTSPAART
jgi:rhamnosyltransferase